MKNKTSGSPLSLRRDYGVEESSELTSAENLTENSEEDLKSLFLASVRKAIKKARQNDNN